MNIYAFLLKNNGKLSKIQKGTLKIIIFTQKDRKSAKKCAKRRQCTPKMARLASKVSPREPKWVHLVRFLATLDALLAAFDAPLLAALSGRTRPKRQSTP